MSWFDEQRKDYQKAPPQQANPAADIGKMAPPEKAPLGVSVTDLGNTDTGMGGEVPERPNDPAYMAIWREVAEGLKNGRFPATESRNYWTKRVLETSGTVDDYWTRRMQAGPSGQAAFHGGTGGGFGGGTIGDLTAPFTEQYAAGSPYPSFAPPSGQQVLDEDPGYGFRLGQGQKALEQSAAARGTLNTGGTLRDVIGFGQSLASQEYKSAYDRALGKYQTNYRTQFSDPEDARYRDYLTRYNVFRNNQDSPFSKYLSVAQLGANATA